MLYILFQIGPERYALDTARVREVLPLVEVKAIPLAAPGLVGVFNYHASPVPLIDLSRLCTGIPARSRMSTRILLVNYASDPDNPHLLGLLVEHATETLRRSEEDFVDSGVTVKDAPYLGPVTSDPDGLIQRLDLDRLLPAEVRDALFTTLPEFD